MKKVLFWVLACLFTFAFVACERTVNPYDEDPYKDPYEDSYNDDKDKDDIDPIEEKEVVNYCEVTVDITSSYKDFKITYEGGYGLYEGTYLVPQGTSFSVKWTYKDKSYQETFEVCTAKSLYVRIYENEAKVILD